MKFFSSLFILFFCFLISSCEKESCYNCEIEKKTIPICKDDYQPQDHNGLTYEQFINSMEHLCEKQ
ncbi:MAG: hypothetical protein N4A45_09210 [Flavobacteriales bacterium]|jgi:hypothetical protein|nr:hypothetical protein [Flavobacteriales bacterium]